MSTKLNRIIRELRDCHDQANQEFDKSKEADRFKLFQEYAKLKNLAVPGIGQGDSHNQIICHLDLHHPLWRGYDPYVAVQRLG